MKIRKMLLPLILMVLCLVLLPSKAEAATIASGTCGDNLTWTLDDAGTLTISGTGAMENYDLGDSPWFSKKAGIKTVSIQDGVTSIGDNAFVDSTDLTSITIPNSVTSIGAFAFFSCYNLDSVAIPDGVTSIADWTFANCVRLTSIEIPNSITSIGEAAFAGCRELASVAIPDSVTSIGTNAFDVCSNLTSITIGDGVISIGDSAFKNCGSLTKVTMGNGVTNIGNCAFEDCGSLTSITIPNSVIWIGDYAFYCCSSLTSVTIPDAVISIGKKAFLGCDSMTDIWVDADNTVYSNDNSGVLFNKDKTSLLYAPGALSGNYTIPDSVISIGEAAFAGCRELASVAIPDSVTSIGTFAFAWCSNLTTITIGNGVTSTGDYAFFGCSSLTDIYYGGIEAQRANISIGSDNTCLTSATWHYQPELIASGTCGDNLTWTLDDTGTLTISGTGAMENYSDGSAPWYSSKDSIKTVSIVDGVTSIGDNAFYYCTNLTSVTAPDSVTGIGDSAFYECWALIDITIPEGVTSIGEYAFSECSFTSITIPSGVTVIADGVFSYTFLDSITILDGVTSIGNDAFLGSCLTSISIPDSVTSIGESAFEGCELTSIAIPDSVTYIGNLAFSHCVNLTTVTMSDAITSIGDWTFNGCQALTDITIPAGVTSIGEEAFCGCHSLKNITIPDSVTAIGSLAFYVCDSLTSITIPGSVTFIGDWVFNGCDSLTGIWVDADNPAYCSDSSGVLFNKDKTILIQAPSALSGAYHVPNSVTIIKDSAFEGCMLSSITIPDSVTSVGDVAFWNCVNLKDVYYNGTSEQWEAIAIGNYNDGLSNAVIHCRVCCAYNAQGIKQTFWTLEEAFGAKSGGYIQLWGDVTESIIVSTSSYLDLNGYTLTGDITIADDATLYVFDSATANYTADNRGKIVGTITGDLARTMNTPKDAYGHNYKYLTLKESDGSYSFHRYYLSVKSVMLVPYMRGEGYTGTAVDYKTVFKCNDVMAQYVTAYGTKLLGDNTVYADYMANGYSLLTGADNTNEQRTWLSGTFKSTNTAEQNATNALLAPTVSAYIMLNDGLAEEVTSAGVQRSLQDVIVYANGLTDLTTVEKKALGKMYNLFKDVLDTWTEVDIANIKRYAAELV